MLTRKGKYGLKALLYLSEQAENELVFVGDIARSERISKKFLDTILGELRDAGLVQSRKGKAGGYRLARPAAAISIGEVVRILDGPLAPFPCASRTRYKPCLDCDETTCRVRRTMLEVREAIAKILDHRNLASMRDMGTHDLPSATPASYGALMRDLADPET